jgi:hypothetical protein
MINSIKPADVTDAYSVKMMKKQQDVDRDQGEQSVRLIEAAAAQPYKRAPGPDSTTSVIA